MAASYAFRATGEGFNPVKVPGAYYEAILEVTGDSSYPTGGYAVSVANLPGSVYSEIDSVDVVNPWFSGTTTYIAAFNKSTNKVQAFAQGTAGAAVAQVEVTAATNLSTFTCSLRVRFH